MTEHVQLKAGGYQKIRDIDPRLVSYNVEMTEVTGGTFWKPYTAGQIAGTEEFPKMKDFSDLGNLMAVFPPADLSNSRLRALAKDLGPAWVRVSGSWATKTYYDFDGHTNGVVPEGFESVLTREQWEGVLDFVKAIGAKLLVSVANCPGVHDGIGPWQPDQARLLFDFSRDYGVPVDAAEFMNEPNILTGTGYDLQDGYTLKEFARDQDLFFSFMRENYPEIELVGPCVVGDAMATILGEDEGGILGADKADLMAAMGKAFFLTNDLLDIVQERPGVFSYHYYNGISERGAAMGGHWDASQALSEQYLSVAGQSALLYAPMRDSYTPGAPMWVTESGDAGCGGNTWASTYLDVPRTVNELGLFATITDGVIFHNTLCSSDYGYLDRKTHEPRPNYWAVLLWNRIMGVEVFDSDEEIREGAHVYVHSRRDGKPGYAAAIINNSTTDATVVDLPKDAEVYALSSDSLRSSTIMLNGAPLALGEDDSLPELAGRHVEAGAFEVAPASVVYVVM